MTSELADTDHPAVRALAELTALRSSLERLEAALVVRAREDGCWWSEIGAALGLTRQGAHRRHAARDPVMERRRRREARLAAELGAALAASLQDVRVRRGESDRPGPRIESVEGHALISSEILASYAADAAREVGGVRGLVESSLHRHRGVRIVEEDGAVGVELHLAVDWGADLPALGAEVQRRVTSYLGRMADVTPASVDVVVAEIAPPPGR